MHERDDDTIAAPPDDGGHLGAHSRPQDSLQAPEPDDRQRRPPLHRDAPRGAPEETQGLGVGLTLVLVALAAGAVIGAAYCGPL